MENMKDGEFIKNCELVAKFIRVRNTRRVLSMNNGSLVLKLRTPKFDRN